MLHTALDSLILYRKFCRLYQQQVLCSSPSVWHFVSVSTKTESLQHGLDAVQPWSEWDRISLIIGSATKGFPKDFSWNGSQVFLSVSFLPLSSLSRFLVSLPRLFFDVKGCSDRSHKFEPGFQRRSSTRKKKRERKSVSLNLFNAWIESESKWETWQEKRDRTTGETSQTKQDKRDRDDKRVKKTEEGGKKWRESSESGHESGPL